MAGRRTNLALLALLVLAFATGVASWAMGSALVRWIVIAHGIVGLGIVALAPWKRTIANRGLARRRPGRGTAIAFAVLYANMRFALRGMDLSDAPPIRTFRENVPGAFSTRQALERLMAFFALPRALSRW